MPRLPRHGRLLALLLAWPAGCGPTTVADPMEALARPGAGVRTRAAAIERLGVPPHDDEAALELLAEVLWRPGYAAATRADAFRRLEVLDVERLRRTLASRLPDHDHWDGLEVLSGLVADRGWRDLGPALVASWARPVPGVRDESKRPEYDALVRLYGEDGLVDAVFALFAERSGPGDSALRARAWELLHRLGHRERLVTLVAAAEPETSDLLLTDLVRSARELGVVPRNREEMLWLRILQQPRHDDFRAEARAVVADMASERVAELEVRHLAVAVAAARHRPDLLAASDAAVLDEARRVLDGRRFHRRRDESERLGDVRDRLDDWADDLPWGDLVSIVLARQALDDPAVAGHLHEIADRDRADETGEYGGVIALDASGRYVVHEVPAVRRSHDRIYHAPQALFERAYTGLFHFHLHAQRVDNSVYAGPGLGDRRYADRTLATCLVLTSTGPDRMNVDWYRHGGTTVDLGEARRP